MAYYPRTAQQPQLWLISEEDIFTREEIGRIQKYLESNREQAFSNWQKSKVREWIAVMLPLNSGLRVPVGLHEPSSRRTIRCCHRPGRVASWAFSWVGCTRNSALWIRDALTRQCWKILGPKHL